MLFAKVQQAGLVRITKLEQIIAAGKGFFAAKQRKS